MTKAAILSIGDEILQGNIIDKNASYLANTLGRIGIEVDTIKAVADNLEILCENFDFYLQNCDIILTTGGLGPTFDDLTAEAAAKINKKDTVFFGEVFEQIKRKLEERNVVVKESHRRQAFLPEGCELYPNPVGTAYGFSVKKYNNFLFAMPGIPYEMQAIYERYIFPLIKNRLNLREFFNEELKFNGIPESDVDDVIRKIRVPDDVRCIINVSKGDIIIRLRGWNYDSIKSFGDELKYNLKSNFVGYDGEGVENKLFNLLKERKLSLATAESCTGGLISKKITDIAGSSEIFCGGIVSYSDRMKECILGIDKSIIELNGAVSETVALKMAEKIAEIMNADVSISVTGIAGPGGGTTEKPVGTVYIAVYVNGTVNAKHYIFNGDRETIRERTAKTAIRFAGEETRKVL